MQELKPCPFCGGAANKPEKSGGSDERNGYNFTMTVRCQDCRAAMTRGSKEGKGGWCEDSGQALSEVVKAWNRRVGE